MAVAILCLGIADLCRPVRASCQAANEIVVDASGYRVRILWSPDRALDSTVIARLIGVVRTHILLPGVPANPFIGRTVTISLATELRSGVDAWASPSDHLISRSLDGVLRWTLPKLRQVVQHEMAHLELSAFLGGANVPAWFEEGIAEWWADGLTCEGKTRIRLALAQRRHDGDHIPPLFGSEGFERSRLAYDYLASYFEYLNVRGRGVVRDGRLLAAVKKRGVNRALTAVLTRKPADLEEAWWSYMVEQYDGLREDSLC